MSPRRAVPAAAADEADSGARDLHVIPLRDLRAHNEQARACWCEPSVVTVDEAGDPFPGGRAVVIHRSADGRELIERHGVQ